MRRYSPVSDYHAAIETLKCVRPTMRTPQEHMSYCQSTVIVGTLWLILSIKNMTG